jgi:ferrous iron transport protein B
MNLSAKSYLKKRHQNLAKLFHQKRFGQKNTLLVGNLKVGKSTLFSWLSNRHKSQAVYPGTGVELTWGGLSRKGDSFIIDAPGVNSLHDRSEDAFVVRDLLIRKRVDTVVLVLDAKNLRRGLTLALQLAEYELPMVVALNMSDEASQRGIKIDIDRLRKILGTAVIFTVAVEGRGLRQLKKAMGEAKHLKLRLVTPETFQTEQRILMDVLSGHKVSSHALAYSLMAQMPGLESVLSDYVPNPVRDRTNAILASLARKNKAPDVALMDAEQTQAEIQIHEVLSFDKHARTGFLDRLAVWTRQPLTGIPIAFSVLAFLYLFVGCLGAGTFVDFLEGQVFGDWILPGLQAWLKEFSAVWVEDLLMGQFGLLTVGIVLPLGIVLPVLFTFFLSFAFLEDSGYLSRLSLLVDRVMRRIGLNGKGLIPMVMGLSCVTMAVLTTRVLDTKKQRIISTLLLVLAMPCAPLLGVMMVVLARLPWEATVILFVLMIGFFVGVGVLANLLIPGKKQDFILELTPLRIPKWRSILSKTGQRLFWFLKEAIPFFILGTLMLHLFEQVGWIDTIREVSRPVLTTFLGLPPESADVFLMSFIRREAGAALLVQQTNLNLYSGIQAMVTLLVMTLMVPCVNTLLVMFKERGFVIGSLILILVLSLALVGGAAVNFSLIALGVQFGG